jgi:hypothetical protein
LLVAARFAAVRVVALASAIVASLGIVLGWCVSSLVERRIRLQRVE